MRFIGARQVLGYTLSGLAGLLLAFSAGHLVVFALKAAGAGKDCPWRAVARIPRTANHLVQVHDAYRQQLRTEGTGEGLAAVRGPRRTFWVAAGDEDAAARMARELAREELIGGPQVREGDVIIDAAPGAGAFADLALERGAVKLVLIEGDALRRQALARTFAAELASLRVVLRDAESADDTVRNLGLARVDLLRAARADAIAGAADVLRRWHPRVLSESAAPEIESLLADARYTAECLGCGVLRRGGSFRIEPAAFGFR